jgi:ABC-type molybdate transport system substrate-binding protein
MLRCTALALLLALTAALPAQAQDKTVTVYAAVSMKNALDDIDAAFTKTTGIRGGDKSLRKLGAGQGDR